MSGPTIGVAIPARQAAAHLGHCLAALRVAGLSGDAVVVVDDGSTDGTGAVAAAAGVRVLHNPVGRGAAAARNAAAAALASDVILFVDADVAPHPDAATRIRAAFAADPGLDAVFGAYDTAPAAPGLASRYRNLLHHWVHVTGPRAPETFWTGLGAVRRTAFERLGGFDARLRMMEDIDFGLRLTRSGGRIALDPAVRGTHHKRWSLAGMVRTDLFDRAIPWSRLMLSGDGVSRQLNLALHHRIGALLSALVVSATLGAVFAPGLLWLAAIALAGFVAINVPFFAFLGRTGGWPLAFAAVPLHILHGLCALAGFGWVLGVEHLPRRLGIVGQARPTA